MTAFQNSTASSGLIRLRSHRDGRGDAFAAVMPDLLAAADDCGGLAALPFVDGEPGLGVSRGGSASLVGLSEDNATPGNAAKAMLLASIFNLRMGSDQLDSQGFPRTEIILSGGLTKTRALGQILADAFDTPVTGLDGATEGTACGAAVMAKFRAESLAGRGRPWPVFLAAHASGMPTRFTPRPAAVATLVKGLARHRHLVALHAPLAESSASYAVAEQRAYGRGQPIAEQRAYFLQPARRLISF